LSGLSKFDDGFIIILFCFHNNYKTAATQLNN
jgi:hypothetical protein